MMIMIDRDHDRGIGIMIEERVERDDDEIYS